MPNPYNTGFSELAASLGLNPEMTQEANAAFGALISKLPPPKTIEDFDNSLNPKAEQPNPVDEKPWVMNHLSTDYDKWVDYDGSSFKDWYSLRLKDGSVINLAYPNAGSWMVEPLAGGQTDKGITLELERGLIYSEDLIAQIRLANDTYISKYVPTAATGVERIKRNRQMFRDNLMAGEDPKLTEPKSIQARHYSVYIGEEQIAGSHRNQLKGELFTRNEDGTWSYHLKTHIEFGAVSGFNPNHLKLVKQFGAILRFEIDDTVTCTSDERVADRVISSGRFVVVEPGRRPDFDWAAYLSKMPPMILRVHFSHKY